MLNTRHTPRIRPPALQRTRQRGVVLLVALIMLIAMTLAGIALVRSIDTSNIIAGNLAFQQAATHAGDVGVETAINWLETNNNGTTLQDDNTGMGYRALVQNPGNSNWEEFWNTVLSAQARTLSTDTVGNTVAYAIERLCNNTGDPVSVGHCAQPQTAGSSSGGSKGSGVIALQYNSQIYYRITARIRGPRNTVSYVQAIVAM